jgi:hypothetical protein
MGLRFINHFSKFLPVLLAIIIINCDSSKNLDITSTVALKSSPVITGIRITSYSDPDGIDGFILGNPSYPMPGSEYKRFSVFPNPSYDYGPGGSLLDEYYVTFAYLPENIKIEIFRGIAPGQDDEPGVISNGAAISKVLTPVEIIHKNSDSQFMKWNLIKEDGSFIPSGLYRAYFYLEGEGLVNWLDIYIINRKDCRYWSDPTGWLRNDWRRFTFCE